MTTYQPYKTTSDPVQGDPIQGDPIQGVISQALDTTLNNEQVAWLTMASSINIATGKWLKALEAESLNAIDVVDGFHKAAFTSGALHTLTQAISLSLLERATRWHASHAQHHIVTLGCSHYPERLKTLSNPPLVLFVIGNVNTLALPQIAIVGSRRASHQGKRIATEFAEALASNGVAVTSGLAAGIDAAAHTGGLVSDGGTIAVMGTGPDIVYPPRNLPLHTEIVKAGGACITEFFPGVSAKPWHFPRRNRIIAAISLGTLVVEAKIKSGTLITANLAADMGREVFAVPGSIFHAYSEGCHWLIQQGAKLVTCVDDIFDEIVVSAGERKCQSEALSKKSEVNNLATDKLLDSVDYDITAIDVIAQRCTSPVNEVMASLLEYELRGLVAAVPGGYIKLRGK
ncbi:DNA-processing protein DprA [Alteromonas sp. 1_MG-2023]|uniref:DNA-processing protein DprA n=1 Tax=Alteromonas sp. 1_MG-2023 TaxID=3062669 RepID=UPI0026E336ED|nr:DNA-processing protein DprA [Alteromonas sp. 1_MG-2023]MDO6566728.1 DNA-processing protein DprA [Alteromonas sp. 1_MG-2023]